MTEGKQTPLHSLHEELGGKMVEFAGWAMPVQYTAGVMAEHNHTRLHSSLFDVSHMGQVILRGMNAAEALETLVPADILGIPEGRQRYTVFPSANGGILDDFMVANRGDHLLLVVNASRTDHDLGHLALIAGDKVQIEHVTDRALIAIQGPEAEDALAALLPSAPELRFMDIRDVDWQGHTLWVTRGGYTGEDGFEVSIPVSVAEEFTRLLLKQPGVLPAGLGARDSLRLEAGLPLYGNEMTEAISPVEAGLGWSIQKVRRNGGARAGGFPGAERILSELDNGPARKRHGLRPAGRAPIRDGVTLFAQEDGDTAIGTVSSGGFGPSVGAPVAMALLPADTEIGATIWAELRGKRIPVEVAELPFIKPSYKR